MTDEYEKGKKKGIFIIRALADYGRGIVFTLLGLFLIFRSYFKLDFNEIFPPDIIDKIFGILCIVYGSWRMYRGYKKNSFK